MGCLNCFGGSKKVHRAESPEPAQAPLPRSRVDVEAFNVKKSLSSRKSSSAADYEHDEGVARSSTGSKRSLPKKSVEESNKTKSDVLPPPSPPVEFVFDLPALKLDNAESQEIKHQKESKEVHLKESPTSGEAADQDERAESPTVPPSLAPPSPRLPQRTPSAASSIKSKPQSRRSPSPENSIKAFVTPLTSPIDETPKPNGSTITATSNNPPGSHVEQSPKPNEPTIKLVTTTPDSPTNSTPEPTNTITNITTTKPDSEKLIEASSSPTTTTTSSPPDTKSGLLSIDTKTSPLSPNQKHRPSFESDTPLTPSTSAKLNRISTAPPEPRAAEKAAANNKHKSRVSRFFSVNGDRRKSQFPPVVENGKLSGVVEEVPDKTVGRKVSAGEKGGHGGGEDEGLGMGKEVGVDMGPKLEGRKWNEDADNESLFCY